MPRRRKPKSGTDAFLDILPQLVGLILLAVFFIPGVKQALGTFFIIAVCVLGVALAALICWFIIKLLNRRAEAQTFGLPPQVGAPTYTNFQRADAVVPVAITPAKPQWTRALLSELEWKRFELVVAAYTRELGYDAKTTRIGADGGVDIEVFEKGSTQPIMVIQCKAWDAYKVGVKPLRELYGVMAADKVTNGAFFTTGEFTSEAITFAHDKLLDLVDGAEFLSRIHSLSPEKQSYLIEVATAGDYTTPTCPSCDVKMILRTAGKGTNAGSEFWGCPSYPRCRQTFKKATP